MNNLICGSCTVEKLAAGDMNDYYSSIFNIRNTWSKVGHELRSNKEASIVIRDVLDNTDNFEQLDDHSHYKNFTSVARKHNFLADQMVSVPHPKNKRIVEDRDFTNDDHSSMQHGPKKKNKKCSYVECNSLARKGGVCSSHGSRNICSVPDCTNVIVNNRVCIKHGAKRKNKRCSFLDCNKEAKKGGICYMHGAKRKKCFFPECTNVVVKGGACNKHGRK
jgi:hypothetical protein